LVVPVIEDEVALTLVVPPPTPDTTPLAFTRATRALPVVQVAVVVMSCVLASVNVPVALNGSAVPRAIDELAGVIAMETKAAAPTVSVVDPLTPAEVACMVVLPCPTPLASPAAVTVATDVRDELQEEELVTSCVLPSEKVPVAVNC
jgi:hypothetical protein